jgi:hypothetical protein
MSVGGGVAAKATLTSIGSLGVGSLSIHRPLQDNLETEDYHNYLTTGYGSSECSDKGSGMPQLPVMGAAILHHKHGWRRSGAHGPEASLLPTC